MKRKALLTFAIAALAVLATAVGSIASSDISKPVRLHIQEPGVNVSWIDTGDPGTTQGDYLVFGDPLINPNTQQVIGHNEGSCLLTDVANNIFECSVTFVLKGGSISVEGPYDGNGGVNVGSVDGGTGIYRNARGQVRDYAVNDSLTDFAFELIP